MAGRSRSTQAARIKALADLLVPAGYPREAAGALYERGMEPEELAERLRARPADPASIERTHGFERSGRVAPETLPATSEPTLSAIMTVKALHVYDDEGRVVITLQDAQRTSPVRFVVIKEDVPRFPLGARVRVTIEPV